MFDAEEQEILDEFLAHGRAVRAERARAAAAGEAPDFVPLVRGWGGVTLAYRKRMTDSPAYRLNHEEVIKALEEGICFAENLDPKEIVADDQRSRAGDRVPTGRDATCRAAGAHGAGGRRHVAQHHLREGAAGHLRARLEAANSSRASAPSATDGVADARRRIRRGFFTSYNNDGRLVSYYGDNHPRYAGNVVKAMASAKHGYRARRRAVRRRDRRLDAGGAGIARRGVGRARRPRSIASCWRTVERVERLTPTIVEVVVKAPAAARHFQPGQFYRLQNFEALAPRADGDGRAAAADGRHCAHRRLGRREQGLLSLIALEMGVSSRLCALPEAGRAGRRDGAHGHAHRNPARRDGAAGRRRPRQRGAVLDRQGAARDTATASSTSPATRRARTSSSARRSRPRPIR